MCVCGCVCVSACVRTCVVYECKLTVCVSNASYAFFSQSFTCLVQSCEIIITHHGFVEKSRPEAKLFLISDQFLPDLSPTTVEILSFHNRRRLLAQILRFNHGKQVGRISLV